MVFFHGYLSSKEAFSAQIAYFSRFYRVTALDFLGFGQSGALKEPFSVDDYAVWTKNALRALGIECPHVIAHSFGCRVAIKMASMDTTALDRLVLTGPAGIIRKRGVLYYGKVWTYRAVRKIAPEYAEKRFGSKEYRTLSPIMKESYKKIVNEDLRACAEKVENPTLIIEGRSDRTTPLAEAQIYQKYLKKGALKQMDGGHFAFVENPVLFNLLAEEFLYE
ncbi:MAG: alpha/beta hydrolase [Clostridia bacterium]|nr:alpha/beta hydrolase [Clostridia bacterium]